MANEYFRSSFGREYFRLVKRCIPKREAKQVATCIKESGNHYRIKKVIHDGRVLGYDIWKGTGEYF